MALALDFASGPRERAPSRMRARLVVIVIGLVAIAGAYRLWNIATFPGEAGAIQIEDFQTGQWGDWYQNGQGRVRWEYLSHQWLAGLGIWIGGHTMLAMRVPFAIVSALKVIPLFAWLLLQVGLPGALVGATLCSFSSWDIVLSRTANNQNAFIVATAFALLAGPVRRGRLSAYIILGLLSGYLLHEYVAYRPLIFLCLIGTTWISVRDDRSRWVTRLSRPILLVGVLVAMGVPLFLGRLSGPDRLWGEYFNGWNRAHAIQPYYNPDDSWRDAVNKRVDRSFDAMGLFFFTGDGHPGRNTRHPLLDPVTGALLIVGIGCAVARSLDPVFALTLVGLLGTIAGSLVFTGNFDVARVGGAVPYVYACVGYGAACIVAVIRRQHRALRLLLTLALGCAVMWSAYRNTDTLRGYWSSKSVQRALRNNLAYLSGWLGRNARDDEQVVGLAPGFHHVLLGNDAAWLRGREMRGIAAWDLNTTLQYWVDHPGKTLLLVFAGESTKSAQAFLESLLPGLSMQFVPDTLKLEGDIAYAHLEDAPPQLANALAAMRCHGVQTELSIIDRATGGSVYSTTSVAPFIDAPAIPGALRSELSRMEDRPARVMGRFSSDIIIKNPGEYRFFTQVYPGGGQLTIDKRQYWGAERGLALTAGRHQIEFQATFDPDPLSMVARLYWQGPDSGNVQELLPFYRNAAVDPACVATLPPPASTGSVAPD